MEQFIEIDGQILIWIQQTFQADWLTPIMKAITHFGDAGIFWSAVCILLLAIKKTRKLGILCAASLALTALCCNAVIKPAVDRTRPYELFEAVQALKSLPHDPSFPSGHSSNSMAPAWAMFIATFPVKTASTKTYDKGLKLGWGEEEVSHKMMHRFGIAAVILALLIGFSRLYLGMHFPSDVVCGLLLGMLCATIAYAVFRQYEIKHDEEVRNVFGGYNENTDRTV